LEYEDRVEAICTGDVGAPRSPQPIDRGRIPEAEQDVAAAAMPEYEPQNDDSEPRVVRNDLARLHMMEVMKSRQRP